MLPDPADKPLMTVEEVVQFVPTLGRSAAYEAARRQELPTIRYGRKLFVVTAALRRQWGIDPPIDEVPAPLVAALRAMPGGRDA